MSEVHKKHPLSATETPKGYTFNQLLQAIREVIELPEDLIRTVFAVVLSVKLDLFPPLWLMLIGVPSSAKTDLLSLFRDLDFVYFIDSMTMNPFASGYVPQGNRKAYDLLPEINGKCFICKDYTTIFSLAEETTRKLLGELVSIYDGDFAKFSPTRGLKVYQSTFSHLGAITPAAISRHQRYINIIGPRFMFYRIPKLNTESKSRGFEIAWNTDNRKEAIQELKTMVKGFFSELESGLKTFKIDDPEVKKKLERLSTLMARSRGIVSTNKESFTNDNSEEMTNFDIEGIQIEEPWRALQQLKGLSVCLATLDHRNYINDDDLEVLDKIVLASMPSDRAEALEYVLSHPESTAKDLSDVLGKSHRTFQRLLKELEALDIICSQTSTGTSKAYSVKGEYTIQPIKTSDSDTPSEFVSRFVPQKPVFKYSDDEIKGVLQYLTDWIVENKNIPSHFRNKHIELGKEIELEGKRRNLFNDNQLSFEERVIADEVIGKT